MMSIIAIAWEHLRSNTVLAFIAVIFISSSNSFVAYEASNTNNNMKIITATMQSFVQTSKDNATHILDINKQTLAITKEQFEKDRKQDLELLSLGSDVSSNTRKINELSQKNHM